MVQLTPNERFPIEEYMMTKNDCYKSTKKLSPPLGIQVHSVGCKGTNRNRWRRWNIGELNKCAGAFIDTNGIMSITETNETITLKLDKKAAMILYEALKKIL